jgi:hypothetical protein
MLKTLGEPNTAQNMDISIVKFHLVVVKVFGLVMILT